MGPLGSASQVSKSGRTFDAHRASTQWPNTSGRCRSKTPVEGIWRTSRPSDPAYCLSGRVAEGATREKVRAEMKLRTLVPELRRTSTPINVSMSNNYSPEQSKRDLREKKAGTAF